MNTYLTIMVTILVLTQIVRIIQNTIQLRRQYKLFQAQLGQMVFCWMTSPKRILICNAEHIV